MAALFTVLCGLAALCLGYFINFFATGHFVHNTQAILDAQVALIEAKGSPDEGTDGAYLYRFLEDGALPAPITGKAQRFSEGMLVFDHPDNNRRYAAIIHHFADGQELLIGFDITDMASDFRRMQIMGIISIIFVMIVVFVSYLISVFVVSGTNKIAMTAQDIIKTGDLSQRLEFVSRWDDLSNMAAILNALLARIEELMTGVRQVSDNIAHDLRTPLTRMRNHIEDLQKKYGHEDYTALLEEADHVLATFTALLRISRIETEKQRSQFTRIDLQKILDDVAAFYAPLAEEKSISLRVETVPATITGDKDLLFQAYANILDNAIKFTPEQGEILLHMQLQNDHVKITLQDSGAGIREDEAVKIFDRFYRGEQSRSTAGTGLGLSLVKAVIELHDGQITAQNANPGLRIVTIL